MPGIHWSVEQVALLKGLLASRTVSPSQIKIEARTPVAIQRKASRLGLIDDDILRYPWTQTHEQILRCLIKQGWMPSQIAIEGQLLPHSAGAISTKASRLHLVDPEKSRRVRASVRLKPEQQEELKAFLSMHAPCRRTPEEMAILWNETHYPKVSWRKVIYYLEQLNIKQPWRVVMSMPYSKAKQRHRSQLLIDSQERRWKKYRKLLRRRLIAVAKKLCQRRGPKLALRICRDCKSKWPACPPFFTIREKLMRAGKRRYLGRICPLCRNTRIRKHRKQKKQNAFKS